MKELNCSTLTSTLESLSDILGIPVYKLEKKLITSDWEKLIEDDNSKPLSVVWFHVTRVPNAYNYKKGLMPTSKTSDTLIRFLKELSVTNGVCTCKDWDEIEIYDPPKHDAGPHGYLIYENVIRTDDIIAHTGNRFYLKHPERIQKICELFKDKYYTLLELYFQNTTPTIVSFRSASQLDGCVEMAIDYARSKLLGQEYNTNKGFCKGAGELVPYKNILKIQRLKDLPLTLDS